MKTCLTKKIKNNQGFTLLELMIVVGIMIILAATSIVIFNPGEKQREQRDALRVSAISQIASALELYYSENKKYPSSLDEISSLNVKVSVVDPSQDSSCNYYYIPDSTYTYYELYAIKESANFSVPKGQEFVTEVAKSTVTISTDLFTSCSITKPYVFKVSGGLAPAPTTPSIP